MIWYRFTKALISELNHFFHQIDYINIFKSHNNVCGNYYILEVSTSTKEVSELEVSDNNRGNSYSCLLRMVVIMSWSINMTQEKYPSEQLGVSSSAKRVKKYAFNPEC